MGGHRNLLLGGQGILCTPQARHRLPLCVESQTVLAVEVGHSRTGDGLLVSGEAEHGQRHGDGHVDTDLPGLELLLEQGRRGAGAGEDRGAVAVGVRIDQVDRFFGRVDV